VLHLEEGGLALDAVGVAGERAVGADDAVTGDEDGDLVGGAGAGDGATAVG
jgi:hypothetical protein